MAYRDPSNYSFSYKKDVDSIEGIDNRVDELEKGGTGGEVDYNTQVVNKPKLNDEVIEGEKTSDDYHIKSGGSKPVVDGETIIFK